MTQEQIDNITTVVRATIPEEDIKIRNLSLELAKHMEEARDVAEAYKAICYYKRMIEDILFLPWNPDNKDYENPAEQN
jgi:hypothetical protein